MVRAIFVWSGSGLSEESKICRHRNLPLSNYWKKKCVLFLSVECRIRSICDRIQPEIDWIRFCNSDVELISIARWDEAVTRNLVNAFLCKKTCVFLKKVKNLQGLFYDLRKAYDMLLRFPFGGRRDFFTMKSAMLNLFTARTEYSNLIEKLYY